MKKKHLRSLVIMAFTYLFFGMSVGMPNVYAAASGNYTDLLPIGAPVNTTVISNGSGWSLTTLAPSQTFGDALSRAPMTVYQATATANINATTTVSTFTALAQGNVGSATFPASWIASGRSIRVTSSGKYSTPTAGSTWTWAILLGTTSVLTTGALTSVNNQTNQYWRATALLTVAATGASGTVNASYEIIASSNAASATANLVSFSTETASAVTVDLTSQLTVNPIFSWGTANSSMSVTNCVVEFLN